MPAEPQVALRHPQVERHIVRNFSASSTATSQQSLMHHAPPDSIVVSDSEPGSAPHTIGMQQSYEMGVMEVLHSELLGEPLPLYNQLPATPRTLARYLPVYDVAIAHQPPYYVRQSAEDYYQSLAVAEAFDALGRAPVRESVRASVAVPASNRWKYLTIGTGVGSVSGIGILYSALMILGHMSESRGALMGETLWSAVGGGVLGYGGGRVSHIFRNRNKAVVPNDVSTARSIPVSPHQQPAIHDIANLV
jgi:hypothetical protein